MQGFRGCVPRWLLGAGRGFPWASALIVHQHTKIARLRLFGAIAFPCSCNKSVLRAFWGGLFGFIGFRSIFGWVRCFAWLVGLYACIVRRLEVRKRNAAYFLGFIGFLGLLRSCCCLLWFVLCLSLGLLWLLCSCCLCWLWLVLLVGFFPFGRYDKKKGQAVALVLSSFVGCVLFYPIALGITKLLQAVSILKELPTIHAAVNWSLL